MVNMMWSGAKELAIVFGRLKPFQPPERANSLDKERLEGHPLSLLGRLELKFQREHLEILGQTPLLGRKYDALAILGTKRHEEAPIAIGVEVCVDALADQCGEVISGGD
jgi:hypothetical protein